MASSSSSSSSSSSVTFDEYRKTHSDLIYKWFALLLATPRRSHKLERVQKVLCDAGRELGCEVHQDKAGNVILRRRSAKHGDAAPSIAVQAHSDMVCQAVLGKTHNFDEDPIVADVVDGWLRARGTTLGADDGIGVAAALALIEEAKLAEEAGDGDRWPQIEAVITAEEETDMSGAENIERGVLRSRTLVNVDSEEEYAICIGAAGGAERQLHLPVERRALDAATLGDAAQRTVVQVTLQGASGGHTGVQIHEGRASAIAVLGRLLRVGARSVPSLELAAFEGGSAVNAIPRSATAVVHVAGRDAADALERALGDELRVVVDEHRATDPDMALVYWRLDGDDAARTLASDDAFAAAAVPDGVVALRSRARYGAPGDAALLTAASSARVLALVAALPHGVLRMSPDVAGLVETSVAYSITDLDNAEFMAHLFFRGSRASQLQAELERLDALASLVGARSSGDIAPFPGWQPDPKSAALALVERAHADVMGKPGRVYAIHAGLECALIQARYPGLDCVSIGPQIEGAHSPDERMLMESVPRFYALLRRVVLDFHEQNKNK